MAWVRIDDRFDEHPKIAALEAAAVQAFIFGLCYCNRNLTDGFIPRAIGARFQRRAVKALEAGGLWERTDTGWRLHDYLEYQPSRQEVERERARGAERQARHRGSNAQDNGVSNGVTEGVTNGLVTPAPYPNPYPVPKPKPESNTPSLRSGGSARQNGARPQRGNGRVQAVVEAFRAMNIEPMMGPRDYAAIKSSCVPPGLVAEVFCAVAERLYGDDFMRKRLSVHEAVGWAAGWVEHCLEEAKANGEYDAERDRLRSLGWHQPSDLDREVSNGLAAHV